MSKEMLARALAHREAIILRIHQMAFAARADFVKVGNAGT